MAAALPLTLITGLNGTAHAAAFACEVGYAVNDWGTGFTAEVAIRNTGDAAASNWSLSYQYAGDQRLQEGWSGRWSQSGRTVTVASESWNGSLAPGATVTAGANFTYTGVNTAPTSFTVNGVACGEDEPPADEVAIVASPSSLTLARGTTGTFNLRLSARPASDVTVTVARTSGNTGLSVSGPSALTFTPSNWGTARPVTIAAAATGSGAATLTASAPGLDPVSLTATQLDDDQNPDPPGDGMQMEDLNRGLVSVRSGSGNLVSWRLLGTETYDTAFNVYRDGTRVNGSPVTDSTNYLDSGAPSGASYTVRAVVGGVEQPASEPSLRFTGGNYLDVPLRSPGSGYTPVEASPGDADGDGQYELIVKWDPNNAKDNSQSGTTGNVYIDAYRLGGERLWRIDLGRNIRAGAHYTQFQVYDYDGDGRAEVAMKTADGTRDGQGAVIGNAGADHRNSSGYILAGPEYLTMFNGLTGAAMDTVNYDPPRGNVASWGDNYGNRVDRFLAGTAYLDGQRPSLIMARGYYTRAVIAAWDFRDGELTKRWTFDSNASGNSRAAGQGNHQLSIADVDADGRQEIVYGSATINDNGTLMYATGFGHGDALHVGDFVPSRPGLEVFTIHESGNQPGSDLHDAATGAVIHRTPTSGDEGPGRGVAGDIHAGNPGAEFWGSGPNMNQLRNASGGNVGRNPSSANFLVWWDADPVRELLNGTQIDKYGTGGDTRLLTGSGVASSNGTKSTPVLSGDLFGDWREEVIWRHSDNSALRIYATTTPTTTKLHTLAHDAQYRVALAWQNTAYNQPPHPSYFLGAGMTRPPQPDIYVR